MYNRHRVLYSILLFCLALTFFSFRPKSFKAEKKKWVIVIDPGHGGKDPGCHGKRFNEKDIALAVSLKFGHYIEQNDKDVTVIYTRKTDVFVALNERAEIANRDHADLFVCIHCNASPAQDAQGAATYVMGLNKSAGNIEVSKRENSSILYEKNYKQTYNGFDPNSDEAAVLFAMYQNLYLEQSVDLANRIQHEYASLVKTNDNGVKQAGFLVLWRTAMPSLLTEIGFLTNPAEEKILGSQKGQNKIAESIFLAFEQYKAEKEGSTYTPGAYDLTPLAVKTPGDSVSQDSVAKNIRIDTTNTIKKAAKVDTIAPKQITIVPDKTKNEKAVKNDSSGIKIKKMQDAINVKHSDTVAVKRKPQPVVDTTKPNKVANTDTSKIIYKVQFTASATPLSMNGSKYSGIPDIDMYMDNHTYKYTAGRYYTLKEASDLQNKLRTDGYKDAFVVTFRGNKRVILTKQSVK